MKSLEEKKLLVKMYKMMGQPVDPSLLESIEREERLNKTLFKEEVALPVIVEQVQPEPVALVEIVDPKPAETNLVPDKSDQVKAVANFLNTTKTTKSKIATPYRDSEIEGIRKTLAEMMQKISTMSWGGGGTGVVKIWDTDDFVRSSAFNGRFLRWDNGYFNLAEVNPHDVIYTTVLVTSATYQVSADDYYVGVNYAGPTTITLPASPVSGEMVVIKDESGNAQNNNIHIVGTIDNDTGGATIAINNGALQLIYRNGWRII